MPAVGEGPAMSRESSLSLANNDPKAGRVRIGELYR
jgi:hypothetical protein